MATAILGGLTPEAQALGRHAGIAYTVAGVLANLPLNAARRQLYLPQELLGRHGVVPEAVFAREDGEGLRAALSDLRAHARGHLAAARDGLTSVAPAALPALLPVATVGAALRRSERAGADPFKPAPLSLIHRQWLLWRAARRPGRIFRA
jgi:phytoene synthase